MIIFDCETDNLLDKATKIHVLSWTRDGKVFNSTRSYKDMRDLLEEETILIGHNICRFDVLVLEKILGIKITAKLYDTLPMSWVMYPQRQIHGLESFGEDFGVPKPVVTDWEGLTYEQYKHRCEEDVKINWLLWKDLIKRFKMVYKDDKLSMDKFFQYLTFKMKSAAMAEQAGWRINKELVEQSLATLEKAQEEKVEELRQVMPPVTKYAEKTKPEKMTKKDGTHSKAAIDWFNLLEEHDLPLFHEDPVRVVKSVEQPNPNSSDQVKDWLFSMGWEPCTHDYKKNEDGTERMIPQVRKDGELAPSVKLLIEKNPGVGLLDGLTVIQHRKSIFEGMLESEVGGYVKAEIAGLTNTLRFKHKKPLVNLPGVDKPWGKEIRGSLIADEGTILCGADMTSLEDTTKRHFIYPYDPEYVDEMATDDFDPHLKLLVIAGSITEDEYQFYSWYKKHGH
jgi:DNA polymerase III epsilon subunit-like protein